MGNAVMTISGYLGNSPETKQLQSGAAWTEFVVGMKSGYADKEETNWIRCKVFGRMGESCLNNLLKGDYVTCSGDFEIRHYQKQVEPLGLVHLVHGIHKSVLVGIRDRCLLVFGMLEPS
jgi:single-stranded DNA-binding protein